MEEDEIQASVHRGSTDTSIELEKPPTAAAAAAAQPRSLLRTKNLIFTSGSKDRRFVQRRRTIQIRTSEFASTNNRQQKRPARKESWQKTSNLPMRNGDDQIFRGKSQ